MDILTYFVIANLFQSSNESKTKGQNKAEKVLDRIDFRSLDGDVKGSGFGVTYGHSRFPSFPTLPFVL